MTRAAPKPRLDGPLVVDANVLFSALLRDGTTRHLLLYGGLDLHTPDAIWDELERNRGCLVKKSRATEAAFDLLLDALRDRIGGIPVALVRDRMDEAIEIVGEKDRLDAPYVAATLALDATLWTNDTRLAGTRRVRVVTTAEVVAARGLP